MTYPTFVESNPVSAVASEPLRNTETRNAVQEAVESGGTIYVREVGDSWKADIKVESACKNGIGFQLSRPCPVARLIIMAVNMPRHLRLYDRNEEMYPVVGLVQHCNKLSGAEGVSYYVGVALIGTKVPASFRPNPTQSYRITGMADNGLWTVGECARQFQERRDPRYHMRSEVSITLLEKERPDIYKAQAFTHDISARGVSVVCSLDTQVGTRVKFTSNQFNFFAIAIVRNRRLGPAGATLHLEFVDAVFPVEKLTEEINSMADPEAGSQVGASITCLAANDNLEQTGIVKSPATVEFCDYRLG